jgi:hypothetical protein
VKSFKRPEENQSEELRPRNPQRADIIPTEGFAMVVDGKLNSSFDEERIAQAAGAKLLAKFPMLRVEVYMYNTETKVRTKVEAAAAS